MPIIVVGNLTLGGTGKTPLLIALSQKLRAAGWQPGIISRGYGGKAERYPLRVTPDSPPEQAGDEPVLIALESVCPVIVDPDRLRAAQELMKQTSCDVILSDDGLQHYKLPRDVEIVVVDGQRKLGNRQCLPAGPLREPVSRLNLADWLVVNGGDTALEDTPIEPIAMVLTPISWRQLTSAKTLFIQRPVDLFPCTTSVHAVAGIGHPERFYQMLKKITGWHIIEHSFPDHYHYRREDLTFNDDLPLVMTAKDAVKCRHFAQDNWWYLSVAAQLPDSFYSDIIERLNQCRVDLMKV